MRLRVLAAYAGLTCVLAWPVQALEIRDDRGVSIKLNTAAARIITLAPHLAEIAFAAGVGNRVIAVGRFSDFPPEVKQLPQIGDASRVDIERILALKPDLILAWKSGNQAGDIARLERLGFPVVVTEAARLADIPRVLRLVGTLGGNAQQGEQSAAAFEREIAALRERYSAAASGRAPVRVFYEIWHQPLSTVNGAHMISDAISLCGGGNVFAQASSLVPSVSPESLVAARPELILGGDSTNNPEEFFVRWARFPVRDLRALPHRYVAPNDIQRQSPRVLAGVRAICAHLAETRALPAPKS